MNKVRINAVALAVAGCMMFAGCDSPTITSASPPAAPANISGDYVGTMKDGQGGAGTATATLAQHGATAGGAITDKEAAATIVAQISLTIDSANSLSGTMVVNYAGGTSCTFSAKGAYDPSAGVMTGSYKAVTNCAGDVGSFTLKQQCTDTISDAKRHPMGLPAPC